MSCGKITHIKYPSEWKEKSKAKAAQLFPSSLANNRAKSNNKPLSTRTSSGSSRQTWWARARATAPVNRNTRADVIFGASRRKNTKGLTHAAHVEYKKKKKTVTRGASNRATSHPSIFIYRNKYIARRRCRTARKMAYLQLKKGLTCGICFERVYRKGDACQPRAGYMKLIAGRANIYISPV